MREFGTSIYTRPVARRRPTYHKTSWLDVVRREKRLAKMQAAVDRMTADALIYGTGLGLAHLEINRVMLNKE